MSPRSPRSCQKSPSEAATGKLPSGAHSICGHPRLNEYAIFATRNKWEKHTGGSRNDGKMFRMKLGYLPSLE
ncbi:D-alanine--poly(phosphoribitol) ligase [Anopheles sinensis]|uniref:D-alanine--poly(Phosphoribitol) ligase n=1 Tax=Anopheles sinensis TaxID=74873 RepID=A0A084WQN0_ANOSI|nr:D-alanine--poly(phosphoribitol) ligase [Anopheles sinensis]